MNKARIIITAFNSDDDLHRSICSLREQSRRDFEVVIVNNSLEPIANAEHWAEYNWLDIVQSDKNTGFAGGSNLGAKGAKTEWIITLNPDAWPKSDWFANLMTAANENPEYEMLSSTLLNAEDPSILDGAGDNYSIFGIGWRGGQGQSLADMPVYHRDVLAPCGACAAYRRTIFEKNHGFDVDFFCYLEDLDLGLRLQSQGYKCLHVFDAQIFHVGGGSTSINSDFQLYHTHTNQLRLIAKLTPFPLLMIQLPLYFITQIYLLVRTSRSAHWSSKIRGLFRGVLVFLVVFLTRRPVVQRSRNISVSDYAKLMSWSLRKLRRKAI